MKTIKIMRIAIIAMAIGIIGYHVNAMQRPQPTQNIPVPQNLDEAYIFLRRNTVTAITQNSLTTAKEKISQIIQGLRQMIAITLPEIEAANADLKSNRTKFNASKNHQERTQLKREIDIEYI